MFVVQAVVVDLLTLPRPDNCSLLLDRLEVSCANHGEEAAIITVNYPNYAK